MRFRINNSTEEFRVVMWGGEEEYVKQIIEELETGDVFFDIGSSVGLISVIAAQKLINGTVISFEPDPENLLRLRDNFRLNNLDNIDIQPIAIGDRNTEMLLYTGGSHNYSPSLQPVNHIQECINVKVESVDRLLREGIIPYPSVVKIDIEGAEMMALKGMKNLLKSKARPRILFIELHPAFLPSFNTSVEEVLDYLSQFKYRMAEQYQRNEQILCKLDRIQ